MTRNRAGADRLQNKNKTQTRRSFETFGNHVNGGELSATEVRSARRLEVEYLNKMKLVDRVPYSFIKPQDWQRAHQGQMGRTTLKNQRGYTGAGLVAKEFPPRVPQLMAS